MISREELIKRGARFKDDGSKVEALQPTKEALPEPYAALVAQPTIDTTPIADAVSQISDVVRMALDAQRSTLETLIKNQPQPAEAKKQPEAWNFKIVRDSRGRIEEISAKAVS